MELKKSTKQKPMWWASGMGDSGFRIVIPLVLICFFVFWALKVNGHFDYSHKYHIRNFESERDTENLAAMLDGESLTVWGDLSFWGETTVPEGVELTVIFDGEQTVSGLVMQGEFPTELSFYAKAHSDTASKGDSGTEDDKNGDWVQLSPLEYSQTGDTLTVRFAHMVTDEIKIAVTKSNEGDKWYIGELTVDESIQ